MPTVFVYGTLLRGMSRSKVLRSARFMGLGEIKGALLNLIHYPGLIQGHGRTIGELYDVDDETLDTLDHIEGYSPDDESGSLYLRATEEVTSLDDGRSLEAIVYLYNQDPTLFPRIASGDFRQNVEVFLNDETYYIAYGSNLNPERLRNRVGNIEVGIKGYLDGFRLAFNKSNGDGSGCANLKSAPGQRVPFVAYRLPEGLDQLSLLDIHEGVPDCYRRIAFPFPLGLDHRQALGYLYVTNPARLSAGLRPREDYLEHIETGYRIHGFEDDIPSLLACHDDTTAWV